jgi:Domain of unknown function (DUF4926)
MFGAPVRDVDVTIRRHGMSVVVRTIWIVRTGDQTPRFVSCWLLVMQAKRRAKNARPSLLDVVALLTDIPAQRLARGQVGTIVEQLDEETLLVEFSDDQGRAYAVAPCPQTQLLLVLHYIPEAA